MPALDQNVESLVRRRRMEIFAFLFLTAVVIPLVAFFTVAGYGFVVWVFQMVVGPPGPPSN